jgi:macrolide-specific efflux system membrane fusion protein
MRIKNRTLIIQILTGIYITFLSGLIAVSAQDNSDGQGYLNLEFGVNGRVALVHARSGDRVIKGQLLAELDSRYYKAAVEAAEARVQRALAEFDESQREFGRNQILYEEGSLSGVELEHSNILNLKSKESHLVANAELWFAKGRLSLSTIIAPIDGVIKALNTAVGENIVSDSRQRSSIVFSISN